MNISLIGMSGSGKTKLSNALAKHGFIRICCDDMIEEKLETQLQHEGFSGIRDVARWMGHPYDSQYIKHSQLYLDYENQVMHEVFQIVENVNKNRSFIIDTTGSVIYTGPQTLATLSTLTKVVYLEIPSEEVEAMYKTYIRHPKPVIWDDYYKKKGNENNEDALKRCYKNLLASRAKKYEQLADAKINARDVRKGSLPIKNFITRLQSLSVK